MTNNPQQFDHFRDKFQERRLKRRHYVSSDNKLLVVSGERSSSEAVA